MRLRDEERLVYKQTTKAVEALAREGPRQGVNIAGHALG